MKACPAQRLTCRGACVASSELRGRCHGPGRTLLHAVCRGAPRCPRCSPRLLGLLLNSDGWPTPASRTEGTGQRLRSAPWQGLQHPGRNQACIMLDHTLPNMHNTWNNLVQADQHG